MYNEQTQYYQKIWIWLSHFYGTNLNGHKYIMAIERHSTAKAFIRPNEFGKNKHGVYFNPDHLNRSNEEIIATIAHEFCHAIEISDRNYQGKYHRRLWVDDMLKIGLKPINCDADVSIDPDAKDQYGYLTGTGWNITHNLTNEFRAIIAQIPEYKKLLQLNSPEKPKYKGKICYICSDPKCEYDVKVWGKKDLLLYCGFCTTDNNLVTLVVKE